MISKRICLASALLFTIIACGRKESSTEKGKPGYVKLSFAQPATALVSALSPLHFLEGTPEYFAADYFGIKLLSAAIATEQNNGSPSGSASYVYLNSACPSYEQTTTLEENGTKVEYKYLGSGNCDDSKVTDFLDLSRPAEEVNTALKASLLPVLPGTYNYVMLNFCQNGPKSNNMKYKSEAAGVTDFVETKSGMCGVTTAQTTIQVGKGESVVLNLVYDISKSIYRYPGGQVATQPPTISATLSKQ